MVLRLFAGFILVSLCATGWAFAQPDASAAAEEETVISAEVTASDAVAATDESLVGDPLAELPDDVVAPEDEIPAEPEDMAGAVEDVEAPASVSDEYSAQFAGMTVRQITHRKDFVRSTDSMSSALNTANPGGRRVYHWIGYVPFAEQSVRVYFTSFGEPLTAYRWERTGEYVPAWVYEALDRLVEDGYIELNATPTETVIVDGRG
jgi:hypothetical protein